MRRRVILIALMLCTPGATTAQAPVRHAPAAAGADTVRVGCSGGMNGGISGWLLLPSGRMTRFVGRAETVYEDAGRDSIAVAKVFAELDRIGLRSRPGTESPRIPDAIICWLRIGNVTGRGKVHWLSGETPPEIEPALAAVDSAVGGGQSGAWRNYWMVNGDMWP